MYKKYSKSKFFLNEGTSLFIIVLTKRCNQNCLYCQASKVNCEDTGYDMTKSIAKKTINLIIQSPNKNITIEFQGGEPLLNFEVLKYIVNYVKKNTNKINKKVRFNLVSNLIALDEEILDYLFTNNISICTSLDGDAETHNFNRPYLKGNSYEIVTEKIKMIQRKAKEMKKHFRINAIQTTTKKSLLNYKKIINTYVDLGIKSIYLRPLNKFGLAKNSFKAIGYTPYEFLTFYNKALKYIILLNKKGISIVEGTAQIFLDKVFQSFKANHMEVRSPCGAVIGQIAINYNGEIYTCDEGRMLSESGDKSFKIGNVNNTLYKDLYDNDVTKIMCMSSCTEYISRCCQCPYSSYCGICPIVNYCEEGNVFKNNGYRCIINEGILDMLFRYLLSNDKEVKIIFKKWVKSL